MLTPYPPLDAPTGFSLGYKAWWGLPALPKINTDHPDAREYLMSVAEHWLRFGIDGWRLDVPTEIDDPSFWAEFRRRCRAIRPDAYLVGEIWEVAPDWVGDDGFDALMDYPLGEAILGFVGGPSLDMGVVHAHHEYRRHLRPLDGPAFATRLEELLGVYDPDVVAVQLNLIGSHDAPRALAVLGGDLAALRMATLLQCTLPGAPSIYYGDEIGLTGGNDPANRASFPVGHGSLGYRAPCATSGRCFGCARPSRPCGTGRRSSSPPPAPRSPSSDGWTGDASSSPSTRGWTPSCSKRPSTALTGDGSSRSSSTARGLMAPRRLPTRPWRSLPGRLGWSCRPARLGSCVSRTEADRSLGRVALYSRPVADLPIDLTPALPNDSPGHWMSRASSRVRSTTSVRSRDETWSSSTVPADSALGSSATWTHE